SARVYQAAIGNLGRTDRFACPADQAAVEVLHCASAGIELALCESLHQRDASARRIAFMLVQCVGWAMRQAQAAFHAGVGVEQGEIMKGITTFRGRAWEFSLKYSHSGPIITRSLRRHSFRRPRATQTRTK